MIEITVQQLKRIKEKVKKPDNSIDLRDIQRELVAETGMSAKDARRIVRAWDRQMLIRPGDLAKLFAKCHPIFRPCEQPAKRWPRLRITTGGAFTTMITGGSPQ